MKYSIARLIGANVNMCIPPKKMLYGYSRNNIRSGRQIRLVAGDRSDAVVG
jgi:hypothetical protein